MAIQRPLIQIPVSHPDPNTSVIAQNQITHQLTCSQIPSRPDPSAVAINLGLYITEGAVLLDSGDMQADQAHAILKINSLPGNINSTLDQVQLVQHGDQVQMTIKLTIANGEIGV